MVIAWSSILIVLIESLILVSFNLIYAEKYFNMQTFNNYCPVPVVHVWSWLEVYQLVADLGRAFFKVQSIKHGPWQACGVQAYNGGLAAGSRGRVLGQGGQSPPEAESLLAFQRPMKEAKFAPLTVSETLGFCDVCDRLNIIWVSYEPFWF